MNGPRTGLGEVLDTADEGYQILDPDYRYVYVNDACARQARKPREALLGRTMMEVYPDIELTPMFAVLRKCMTQRVPLEMENEFTFAAGDTTWFELRLSPVPEGVLVRSMDISRRAGMDRELRVSRRVLRVIGEAHQALVRATDERQLIHSVSEIVVGVGGYRMAWVGALGDAAGLPVRPVVPIAAAGHDDGYTEGLREAFETWAAMVPKGESANFEGPTARAIRTGVPVAARFVSADPALAPWRAAALARGYASSLSIPYRVGGEVVGAISIYSSEPDAFDADETRMLSELALTLGQGIETLRARNASSAHGKRLTRLNHRLQRLGDLVYAMLSVRDVAGIARLVRDVGPEISDADGALLLLRDGDELVYQEEDGARLLRIEARRVPLTAGMAGLSIRERRTVSVADTTDHPNVRAAMYRLDVARSVMFAPIRKQDPIGAVGLYWSAPNSPSDDDARVLETLAHAVAIALETVRVLDRLSESEDRYRTLVESVEDVLFSVSPEGRITYISPSIERYGYRVDEIMGQHFRYFVFDDDLPALQASMARTLDGAIQPSIFRVKARDQTLRTVRSTSRAVRRAGAIIGLSGVMVDITELKRTEEQLRASQKMEAIGQLAGGVAHDFNNLLSVIHTYSGFLAKTLAHDAQALGDVEEIRKAGQRAAVLTRQLLAFSRKQVLEPQVIDLNALASDMQKMLRRLVGEDIVFEQRLAPDLGRTKADPGQIEQVLLNLIVNARDAMPKGGTITLETANASFTSAITSPHGSIREGHYVALLVSDTGVGMDETTKQRLFEPFYTTKEVGKGTGLGLSTVYGIVAQSGGSIWFYSELGIGTTFKVYLPRVDQAATVRAVATPESLGGTETLLFVEDDAAVRTATARLLRESGYTVLEAAEPAEALRLVGLHPSIELMVTDVIMPGMSGRALADRVAQLRPDLAVIFMSGYTDNALALHGVLEPGTLFVGKPFDPEDLAIKVRQALDARGSRA